MMVFALNRRGLAVAIIFVATLLAVSVPVITATLQVDPLRIIQVTKSDAVDAVAAFVGEPTITDDLSASDPVDGAFVRYYDVDGSNVSAVVNAHDGTILHLVLGLNATFDSQVKIGAAAATNSAEAWLDSRAISYNELSQTVRLADHGETAEYVVEWSRIVNGVVVPDTRTVGVDAASGRVFRYANLNRPYETPPKPTTDRVEAVTTALKTVDGDGLTVDNAELRVAFTMEGQQRLVWWVFISGPVEAADAGLTAHWVVEVDAMSGAATVISNG